MRTTWLPKPVVRATVRAQKGGLISPGHWACVSPPAGPGSWRLSSGEAAGFSSPSGASVVFCTIAAGAVCFRSPLCFWSHCVWSKNDGSSEVCCLLRCCLVPFLLRCTSTLLEPPPQNAVVVPERTHIPGTCQEFIEPSSTIHGSCIDFQRWLRVQRVRCFPLFVPLFSFFVDLGRWAPHLPTLDLCTYPRMVSC